MQKSTKPKKNPEGFPVHSHSWTVLSEGVFVKKTDRSAFLHHGTGVPKQLKRYFNLGRLSPKQKKEVTFLFKGAEYKGYFEIDKHQRVRLIWYQPFAELIKSTFPVWTTVFKKKEKVKADPPRIIFKRQWGSPYVLETEFDQEPHEDLSVPDKEQRDEKSLTREEKDEPALDIFLIEEPPPEIKISRGSKKSSKRNKKPSKQDYEKIEAENRDLGTKGEKLVLGIEFDRLVAAGRRDLADDIEYVAENDDNAGFDILSFTSEGKRIYIEVKTTRGVKSSQFFMSRAERDFCKGNSDRYFLYRVYNYGKTPRFFVLDGNKLLECDFYAVNYLVGLSKGI